MRSVHDGIHKRTFGLQRQGLCLFKKLEIYATSPNDVIDHLPRQKKTVATILWCNLTKHLVFVTGRKTGIRKGKKCTIYNDANDKIKYSFLPGSMSIALGLLCSNLWWLSKKQLKCVISLVFILYLLLVSIFGAQSIIIIFFCVQ